MHVHVCVCVCVCLRERVVHILKKQRLCAQDCKGKLDTIQGLLVSVHVCPYACMHVHFACHVRSSVYLLARVCACVPSRVAPDVVRWSVHTLIAYADAGRNGSASPSRTLFKTRYLEAKSEILSRCYIMYVCIYIYIHIFIYVYIYI